MVTSVEPAALDRSQLHPASDVLARAFHTNPGFIWAFPDEHVRSRALRWFMRTGAKTGLRWGQVHTTAGAVEGAAVWMTPGNTTLPPLKLLRVGFAAAPFQMGWSGFTKVMGALNRFEHLHKRDAPEPHWYLSILGVDPPRQQRGIGSALIAPGLAQADAAGLPCYLETDKIEDVGFYKKHGFEVRVEEPMGKNGPPFWTMYRPASTPKA